MVVTKKQITQLEQSILLVCTDEANYKPHIIAAMIFIKFQLRMFVLNGEPLP